MKCDEILNLLPTPKLLSQELLVKPIGMITQDKCTCHRSGFRFIYYLSDGQDSRAN